MPEKPTKTTIVHVSHAGLQPGLASTLHVMVVAEELHRLGYPIFMLTKGSGRQETSLPIITPSFLPIKGFRTATFSINAAFCLSKTIKKNLPAVIYYRRSLLDPFPARVSHRLNTPLITELNENWEAHISETHPQWFWKRVMASVERTTFSVSSAVLCPSDTIRKILVSCYPHMASKFRIVYHGVDIELFKPIPEKEAQEKIGLSQGEYLLWAGTPFWWSGMELLRNLAECLSEKRPGCRILFVGDKTKTDAFTKDSWPENVVWMGKMNHKKMPLIYCAARALLAPYVPLFLLNRGYPFKILEALSCGRPVLVTKAGISEEMTRSIGGIRLMSEQLEQWEKETISLLENVQETSKLGQEGREGILRAGLTWKNAANQIHEIIEEVCE